MSTLSELIIKIGADSSGLHNELQKTKNDVHNTFNDISPINNMTNALTGTTGAVEALAGKFTKLAGIAAGGFGLTSLISSAVEAGESTYQLSQRLGIATSEVGKLKRIMSQTGGDIDTAAKTIMRLDSTLAGTSDSSKTAQAWLEAFGVSLKDTEGNLLPLNKQIEALSKGYIEAQKAGHAQEFVMNTLGTRGLALTKTLQQYSEAAENASKVQSIGLDPERMHDLDRQMKVMNMQFGQIKLIAGDALAPIAADILPKIANEMAYVSKLVKEHKEGLYEVTRALVTTVALYKSISAARTIATKASTFVSSLTSTAQAGAQEEALTKAQERAIARRERAIEAAALKEQKAYAKSVQEMQISEAEKSKLVAEYTARRTAMVEEAAASERAIMTAMFQQINAERKASEARAVESEAVKAEAAQAASAQIVEANTAAAASTREIVAGNEAVVVSEAEKAAAAEAASAAEVESSAAAKVAAAEEIATNEALVTSTAETGAAAVVAGEQKVASETAAKAAIVESTAAQNINKAAIVETGVQATVTGGKMAAMSAGAIGSVTKLTGAVWALAGGWLGVGAAIAYAAYCLSQFMAKKMAERKADSYMLSDGSTVRWDKESGTLYGQEDTQYSADYEATNNTTSMYADYFSGYGKKEVAIDENDPRYAEFLDAWWDRHKDDDDYQQQLKAEQAEKDAQARQADIEALLANISAPGVDVGGAGGSGGGAGSSTSVAAVEKTQYADVPIGELVANIASSNFTEGEEWMGNVTSNDRIQCDSFTANIYNQAGIGDIAGYDTAYGTINDSAFRAAGAYHDVDSGYTPQAGDLVDSAHHVGVYLGNGMVRSRDSGSSGVVTRSLEDWDSTFGITGYGSIAEATGGQTVKTEVDKAGAAIADAQRKMQQNMEQLNKLTTSMTSTVLQGDMTTPEKDRLKVMEDIRGKQLEINKLKAAGLDTSNAEKVLDIYKQYQLDELEKKYQKVYQTQKDEAAKADAGARHDYEALAEAEYQSTIHKLDEERKKKEKEVMKDKDDWEAREEVAKWYYAEVTQAQEKLDKAKEESAKKYLEYLEEEGDLAKVVAALSQNSPLANRRQQSIEKEGQRSLAKEYVKIWETAHGSMSEYIADVSETMYSSLSDGLADFITGAKTAKNVFEDFGKSVLNMMAKIAAQRLAATWMSSLFGLFGGGGSSLTSAFTFGGSFHDPTFGFGGGLKFASGGIVTSPTLGLIGEAGESEAVIPLNNENLRAIGGNGNNRNGGVVVNITNKTDSNVKVQDSSYDSDMQKWVLDVVIDGASRNKGGFGSNLKSALGAR